MPGSPKIPKETILEHALQGDTGRFCGVEYQGAGKGNRVFNAADFVVF